MTDHLHINQFTYDYDLGDYVYHNPNEWKAGFQGLGRLMRELSDFRREWAEQHPMPPLPPKKHFIQGRKGRTSGNRPSHLPPPDWKDQS